MYLVLPNIYTNTYILLQFLYVSTVIYITTGRSKLANILFAKQLQKTFEAASSPAISISVNPGGVATDTVLENMGSVFLIGFILRWLVAKFAKTPLDGANSALYAATSPEILKKATVWKGAYVLPIGKIAEASKDAQDAVLAERFWRTSDEISDEILANS